MSHSLTLNKIFFLQMAIIRFFVFGILHTIFVAKIMFNCPITFYTFLKRLFSCYWSIETCFCKIFAKYDKPCEKGRNFFYYVFHGYMILKKVWHIPDIVAKYLQIWTSLAKYFHHIIFLPPLWLRLSLKLSYVLRDCKYLKSKI